MKNLAVLIIILSNLSFAFAQENKKAHVNYSSEIKVYFFNGLGVIYQYRDNEKSGLRLHVDLQGNVLDSENENSSSRFYTSSNLTQNNKNSAEELTKRFSLFISPQYYYVLYQKDKFNFYFGAGPLVSYGYSKHESQNENISITNNEKGNYKSSTINKSRTLGVIGILGIDGSLNENLKIFSELYITGSREWSDIKSELNQILNNEQYFHQTSSGDDTDWLFNISKVMIGISYVF